MPCTKPQPRVMHAATIREWISRSVSPSRSSEKTSRCASSWMSAALRSSATSPGVFTQRTASINPVLSYSSARGSARSISAHRAAET